MLQVYCGGPTGDFGFLEHLAKFLPIGRPVTILDAGANIGGASILFSQLIAFSGEVRLLPASCSRERDIKQVTARLYRVGGVGEHTHPTSQKHAQSHPSAIHRRWCRCEPNGR